MDVWVAIINNIPALITAIAALITAIAALRSSRKRDD